MTSLRVYTIYDSPLDHPAMFVLRGFTATADGLVPDDEPIIVTDTLEDARQHVPAEADVCLPREALDDLVIVETWV